MLFRGGGTLVKGVQGGGEAENKKNINPTGWSEKEKLRRKAINV